jgi:hypothetical protein
MTAETDGRHGARQRLAEEMREYVVLSLYLFACLGAVFLYRAALLEDHGIGQLEFGGAAVKALVLAKFAMLGRMAGIGEAREDAPLLPAVLRASAGMLLVLVALTAAEEFVVGALRHRGPEGALAEIAGGRWAEVAASVLLLWLILLPYLAFRHLRAALGLDTTRRLMRGG